MQNEQQLWQTLVDQLFSDVYDGAEDLQWVPRNPMAHVPIRPGGG